MGNRVVSKELFPLAGWQVTSQPPTTQIHRVKPALTLLGYSYSAIPFLAAQFFLPGKKIITPIYFILHIVWTRGKLFYYPFPLTMDPEEARGLLTAIVGIYFFPILLTATSLGNLIDGESGLLIRAWNTAHFAVLCREVFRMIPARSTRTRKKDVPKEIFSAIDMPFLEGLYAFLFAVPAITHMYYLSRTNMPMPMYTDDSLTILTFSLFTAWDLRRVNILDDGTSLRRAWLFLVVVSVIFGPPATLAAVWWWRERVIERARHVYK